MEGGVHSWIQVRKHGRCWVERREKLREWQIDRYPFKIKVLWIRLSINWSFTLKRPEDLNTPGSHTGDRKLKRLLLLSFCVLVQ